VAARKKNKPEPSAEQLAAEAMVRRTREHGLSLTGPDGQLSHWAWVLYSWGTG